MFPTDDDTRKKQIMYYDLLFLFASGSRQHQNRTPSGLNMATICRLAIPKSAHPPTNRNLKIYINILLFDIMFLSHIR